jgi:hypothetical protein
MEGYALSMMSKQIFTKKDLLKEIGSLGRLSQTLRLSPRSGGLSSYSVIVSQDRSAVQSALSLCWASFISTAHTSDTEENLQSVVDKNRTHLTIHLHQTRQNVHQAAIQHRVGC